MQKIIVDIKDNSYYVVVGNNILGNLNWLTVAEGQQVVVVADEAVYGLFGASLCELLEEKTKQKVNCYQITPGENSKSFKELEAVCDFLAKNKVGRNGLIVALGGGVTSDLAGFAAAVWLRGISYASVATTLLAAVDASIGGKTAINIAAGKNLVGAFKQPKVVCIDVATLRKLPDGEFSSGMAEVVKHSLLDPTLFSYINANLDELAKGQNASSDLLVELIAKNIACKAHIVEQDEKEAGIRMHLNLGHTFAHAIEKAMGLGTIKHGEAVAIGLVCACNLAARTGIADKNLQLEVERMLQKLSLPIRIANLNLDTFYQAMDQDKKRTSDGLRFVLPVKPGEIVIKSDIQQNMLAATVTELSV